MPNKNHSTSFFARCYRFVCIRTRQVNAIKKQIKIYTIHFLMNGIFFSI